MYTLLLGLALLPPPPPVQGEAPGEAKLLVGESTECVLPASRSEAARIELQVPREGPVTVAAESLATDVDLRLVDASGSPLGTARLGGLGTDARLTIDLAPGSYTLLVRSTSGTGRAFVARAWEGAQPLPVGTERTVLEAAYWNAAALAASAAGDTRRELLALRAAGQHLITLERWTESLERFRALLARAEETGSNGEAIFARGAVGWLLVEQRRLHEAIPLLDRALSEFSASGLSESQRELYGFVLRSRGDAHLARNELAPAGRMYARLLEACEGAALAGRRVDALSRLATLAQREGRPREAQEILERQLDEAAELGGDVLARTLLWQAGYRSRTGEPEQARLHLREALDHAERPTLLARVYGELGYSEELRGHLGQARRHYERALKLAQTVGAERSTTLARVRLAHIAWRVADPRTARAHLERALEDAAGTETQVEVWNETGFLRGALGDLPGQSAAHRRAIEIAEQAAWHEGALGSRINLGRAEREEGRIDQARSTASAALELALELEDPVYAALAQVNLAYVELLSGEVEAARERAEVALATLEEHNRVRDLYAPLETIARASIRLGDVERARHAILAAGAALEHGAQRSLSIDEASGWRSHHAWWAETLTQDLTALLVQRTEAGSAERDAAVEQGFADVGAWKHRALLEGITVPRSSAGRSSAVRLAPDVVRDAILEPGTALIEYAVGSQLLFAYVLTPGQLLFVELGEREAIESLCDEFIGTVSRTTPVADVLRTGSELYDVLLAPVLERLDEEPETLVIVPTASLATLPFDALVTGTGNGEGDGFASIEFLIDRYLILHGPSSPVLVELADLAARQTPGRVLLLGDPLYAPETDAVVQLRTNGYGFERLAATRDEVCTVARLLLDAGPVSNDDALELLTLMDERSGSLRTDAFELYLGEEANASRLNDLSDFGIVHIGAHGLVDPVDPRNSGIALSATSEEDGYVSIHDVLRLELDLQLAVLSACDTALGTIRQGEGVQSIAGAFLRAGARSVVASLWQVRDLETSALMRDFYAGLLRGGLSAPEALRAAKLTRRRARDSRGHAVTASGSSVSGAGHPYYWASFVFIGPPPL